jgi:peptidylprolyl isomerase domain and WD repeat-containing protein 1
VYQTLTAESFQPSPRSDADSPKIYIYDARGDGKPLHVIEKVHRDSVHLMVVSCIEISVRRKLVTNPHINPQYSPRYDCVISADESGFVEYWRPQEPWSLPEDVPGLWQYKSQTDLFEFKKVRE